MVAVVVVLLAIDKGELRLAKLGRQIPYPVDCLIEVQGQNFEDRRYIPLELLEGIRM